MHIHCCTHNTVHYRYYQTMIQEGYMTSMVRKGYRSKAHEVMEMCSTGTITNNYMLSLYQLVLKHSEICS